MKGLFEDSRYHSAVSWWYVGSDSEFSYFVRRESPWPSDGFKIQKNEVSLGSSRELPLSSSRKDWVNVKVRDLEFRPADSR